MANRRGKSWDFPDYTSREELEALYQAKIRMLETTIANKDAEIERLKDIFAGQGVPSEVYEVLDADIVMKCGDCNKPFPDHQPGCVNE